MPKNAIQEAHAASLRSLLVCVTFGRLKTGGELLGWTGGVTNQVGQEKTVVFF